MYFADPMTDQFYLTDISPHYDGIEIAILDYGPSNDPVTHFFSYDGELHYLGAVTGFPFREESNWNGFASAGTVEGIIRTDIIETCYSFESLKIDTLNNLIY